MHLFRTLSVLLLILLCPFLIKAQETDLIWNPEISYSWSSSNTWSHSAKLSLFNSIENFDNYEAIEYAELQLITNYALNSGIKISGGYYYRNVQPLLDKYQYEHRFLQQVSFSNEVSQQKLSHRMRLEQRVRSSSYQNRFRYRLELNTPLSKKDEANYLLTSNEAMASFNKETFTAENRLTAGFGFPLSKNSTFETGLQYRTQSIFSDDGISHLLLLFTSFSFE